MCAGQRYCCAWPALLQSAFRGPHVQANDICVCLSCPALWCCAQAKQAIAQSGLLPAGLPTHLAASICSGFVSALISTPADVIKTRLMAQAVTSLAGAGQAHQPHQAAATVQATPAHGRNGATGSSRRSFSSCSPAAGSSSSVRSRLYCSAAGGAMPHYRGMLDCAVQTVRQEGLLAMYKG
jgi:hypothetical protein